MAYSKMTHDQHLVLADKVRATRKAIREIYFEVQAAFGVSHPTSRALWKAMDNWDSVKARLDTEYHHVTTDKQFGQHGHVYYGERRDREGVK